MSSGRTERAQNGLSGLRGEGDVERGFTSKTPPDDRLLLFPQHNKEDDLWIIVDSAVYDLSRFVDMHPGTPFPFAIFRGRIFDDFRRSRCL